VIYAVILAAAFLAGAAILALVRAEKGPSMLDRTVAFDVFTTTLVAGVALEAAWSRRTDTLVLLVVLSLVGFVGSVTISRFAAVEPEDAARVRTREEVEEERRAERAAEEAAVRAEQERREALRAEGVEAAVRAAEKEAAEKAATAEVEPDGDLAEPDRGADAEAEPEIDAAETLAEPTRAGEPTTDETEARP